MANSIDKSLYEMPEGMQPGEDGKEVFFDEANPESPEEDNFSIEEDEDGGATVTFGSTDPESIDISSLGFGDNLALVLDDAQLHSISKELKEAIEDDDQSRAEWKKAFEEGLSLLGLTYDDRTEPFRGSSGVVHPILNEAVTQFQAQAYKEMLPSGGPVRTQIVGAVTPEREKQADRVKTYMNYMITTEMEEFDPDYDQMLWYTGYGGSAFKKVYYDGDLGRATSPFVLPQNIIVPYGAKDLMTAQRVTHVLELSKNDLIKQQVSGFYRDIDVADPKLSDRDVIEEKIDKITGVEPGSEPSEYVLYECHTYLDIEGFEDTDKDGKPTGIRLPYIVTMNESNGDILAIRKNYKEDDPKKRKRQYFVHYKFIPGLGFYGFGLVHLIGNLARGSTSVLRQLIDAGTLANLPAGFKAKGIRIQDQESPFQPGEWRDIDAPGGALRDSLLPLPYKEPSQTLFQLLGFCVLAAEKFIGTSDIGMSDSNQELPVGTTIALLERGSRVMSAVHKRLHYAQKQELRLLAQVFAEYMPPVYPYEISGAPTSIKQQDFSNQVDVIPVSDPNIFSMTQRISLAQEQLRLAQAAPQMHNLYEAYRRMYSALGVQDIEQVLPPPPKPHPDSPSMENARSMLVPNGAPALQAFPDQDHTAHIEAHVTFYKMPLIQQSPQVQGVLLGHIFEHVSMAANQTVMQSAQQMAMQAQSMGMAPPDPRMMASEQAKMEAEMIAKIMEEVMPKPDQMDPLIALQQKDLELRNKAIEYKAEEAAHRIDLDERRLEAKKQTDEERRLSNEDISQLRANISLQRAREAKGGR